MTDKIGVGMLGYSFMGRAHSYAFKNMPHFFSPPPAIPELVSIYGRNVSNVKLAAENYGFRRFTTDWRNIISDGDVHIVDNCLPNYMHHKVSIEAIEHGKHVLCEKPLGMNAAEAKEMWETAKKGKVKAMVAFNYRFVPAVILARELVKTGKLGRIYHFRARYLQQWLIDPNFPLVWRLDKDKAGTGPIGDLGSHIIDLAHFILGDIRSVYAVIKNFIDERPLPYNSTKMGKVTVEDAFVAVVEFYQGAIGTLEASRFATGRMNYNNFEINGENGSIEFNLERMNELKYFIKEGDEKTHGWSNILVTEKVHPYIAKYWPSGHILGWDHTFINEVYHLIDAIVDEKDIGPLGATFEDGYRNNVILDALVESATEGKKVNIHY
ncbi:MAG: Gfo/Idh/MocA family oxidoreductase [Nitrososphaeria archaeon]